MNEFIKTLNKNYTLTNYRIKSNKVIFHIESEKNGSICPYCNEYSSRVHSRYEREIQDLPLQHKQALLLVLTRKFFCDNPECNHKTFAEQHDFVIKNGKKTIRLNEHIINTSINLSSVNSSKLLAKEAVKVSKSSICDLLKKNA